MRFLVLSIFALLLPGCVTKSDLRREQEVDQLKQELKDVRSEKSDVDALSEELKVEISRMSNLLEEREKAQRTQIEDVKKDISQLGNRMTALEARVASAAASEEKATAEKPKPVDKPKPTYELGKRYFDDGRAEDAIDVLKVVAKQRGRSDEGKKAQFLLAEAYFSNREFASAALEFSEFRKLYPKDPWVSNAIYRQATAFKSMGKTKEARLFYQEVIEKYPKSSFAAKAKQDLKRLK